MRLKVISGTIFAAVTTIAGAADAATASSTLGVSMTITAGCSVAAGTIAFGTQSTLSANVDQTGTLQVTCTNTTPYTVGFDAGSFGGSVTTRKMKGGATNTEFVNYALYLNAGRTSNWGSTIGTDTLAGTGNGSAQTVTVYGRVPPQSIGSPGGYSDTVAVTVTY